MQILRLSIYTGRRRSFVITYLSKKKKYCARLCIYTESFTCEVLFVYVEILTVFIRISAQPRISAHPKGRKS